MKPSAPGPAFFIQFVGNDGTVIEGPIEHATPLGVEDLRRLKADPPQERLSIELLSRQFTRNGEPLVGLQKMHMKDIEFHKSASAFALVPGGWLPPPFVTRAMFQIDSNVLITLERIQEGTQAPHFSGREWWLRFLAGESTVFNPLPYAMEGIGRQTPTLGEFQRLYKEGASRLAASFPKCTVVAHNDPSLAGAYQLLEDLAPRAQHEIAFLKEVGPLVRTTLRKGEQMKLAERICAIADRTGAMRSSLACVCALACVFTSKSGTPPNIGRRILKPSLTYTEQDAYNALSDLRHVELATAGIVAFGEHTFVMLTHDYWLALLWSALNPRGQYDERGTLTVQFDLNQHLFQSLDEAELGDLTALMKSGTSI